MAQVVERYFREVEAASSSLVTPIGKKSLKMREYSISKDFSFVELMEDRYYYLFNDP